MTSVQIELLRPFTGQREIINHPARFKVIAIGRQWGKSEAALIDSVQRLLRGENQWYCSPTNKNTKRMYPKFKQALKHIPGVYTNDSDYLIRMPTGAFIQFVSLHEYDNLRGEGLHHIKVDEAAFIKAGVFDKVLRPMLAAKRGSAWLLSSPNGKNEFWQWYQRGLDSTVNDWYSFHAPSYTSPVLSEAELDSIRLSTPERVFRQEYLAEFLDDGGAVFRNIRNCINGNPKRSGKVIFGVDWARYSDYTVIVALDYDTGAVLEIDRFNQIDWTLQRGRLKAMFDRWKPSAILAEKNSIGEPNIEELRKDGLPVQPFDTTASSKQQIINQLALAFEQGDISILPDETLIGELQAYTIERLPSGNLRYTAPSGLHDDMVMALALAWHKRMSGGEIGILDVPEWVSEWRG
jgi:phage FluMu gp28-like protein